MRALGPLLALVSATLLAGCSGGSGGADRDGDGYEPRTHVVEIADRRYDPVSLAVRQGDTVRFLNLDGVTHTATLASGERDTGDIAPQGSAALTLPTPGSLRYACKHHPAMQGTILVTEE